MTKTRRVLFGALLISIPLAAIAAALVLYFDSVIARYRHVQLRIEGDWPIQPDPLLGFVPTPNATTVRDHYGIGLRYTIYTDRRGARVNRPDVPAPDTVEILALGGSFTWGHGVESAQTYPQRLAQTLGVSVANLAMAGYGTVQALQLLELHIDLKPNLVIYGLIDDHLRRNLAPCAPSYMPLCIPVSHVAFDANRSPEIRLPVATFSPRLNRSFYQDVIWDGARWNDWLWGARVVAHRAMHRDWYNYLEDPASRQLAMTFLFGKMLELTRENGARLLVAYIPMLGRGEVRPPPTALVKALDEDILFVDVSGAVANWYADANNPLLRFKYDPHPTPEAHRLFAETIAETLSANAIFSSDRTLPIRNR